APPYGADDVAVPGAPAEVALQALPDLVLGGVGVLPDQIDRRHDHSGSAVAALQRVLLVEGPLHGVPVPVARQALDRHDLAAVGLDGEHRAALDALAVHEDRAGAAVAGVAADRRAGLPEVIPEEMDEEQPGLHLLLVRDAVNGHGYSGHRVLPNAAVISVTVRSGAVWSTPQLHRSQNSRVFRAAAGADLGPRTPRNSCGDMAPRRKAVTSGGESVSARTAVRKP